MLREFQFYKEGKIQLLQLMHPSLTYLMTQAFVPH
jgi:hypothetical protein